MVWSGDKNAFFSLIYIYTYFLSETVPFGRGEKVEWERSN